MTSDYDLMDAGHYLKQQGGRPAGLMRESPWRVPDDIEVVDGHVMWSEGPGRSPRFESADFLTDFLNLAGTPSGQNLERKVGGYVRRWGPLNLCEPHGLPSPHAYGSRLPTGPGVTALGDCMPTTQNGKRSEPVSGWRDLAENAVATLYAREKIADGDVPTDEMIRHASTLLPWGMVPSGVKSPPLRGSELREGAIKEQRGKSGLIGGSVLRAKLSPEAVVGTSVRQWLAIGNVRPTFRWVEGTYVFGVEYEGLAGAIAVRLAATLMDTRPLVQCAYCRRWYTQTRRGTYFCRGRECDKKRVAANKRRQLSGQSRRNNANRKRNV